MSMKLYFAPGACSFVPHALLESAGADFEPVMVKLHKGEQNESAYRAVNPRGQVPVLVDDGQTITQIVAIVNHLDARFPEQGFLPRDPLARTRVLETLAWMNNTVHPTFTHVFMPFKFAGTPEAQAELKAFNAKAYAGLLGELGGRVTEGLLRETLRNLQSARLLIEDDEQYLSLAIWRNRPRAALPQSVTAENELTTRHQANAQKV